MTSPWPSGWPGWVSKPTRGAWRTSQESRDAFVGTLLSLPGDWQGLDPGEPEVAALHRVVAAPAAAAV